MLLCELFGNTTLLRQDDGEVSVTVPSSSRDRTPACLCHQPRCAAWGCGLGPALQAAGAPFPPGPRSLRPGGPSRRLLASLTLWSPRFTLPPSTPTST